MEESYSGFAKVYDLFMEEMPYREWADHILEVLRDHGRGPAAEYDADLSDNLVAERNCILDLGCGTGTLTELLADAGFSMIGVDLSEEMLEIARAKQSEAAEGRDILYLCQDMREFELYGTVGAVVSVCDSLNYLLSEEELLQTFRLVNNYLYPGGLFLFDFHTVCHYEEIGEQTIAENRPEGSFIWENYYEEETQINSYELTVFARDEEKKNLFHRSTEVHYQRGYTLSQLRQLVEEAGLSYECAYDADTWEPVTETDSGFHDRIFVVAAECSKSEV